MRVIFMGTATFALPSLTALREAGHEIGLVVTQPDRPAGRGQRLAASPVKLAAQEAHLPLLQPEKVRDPEVVAALRARQPEAIVVVAYGQLLPDPILALPPHGCVNVHASLLPKYRGPAPIQWAIINRETVTGVSIMRVGAQVDAGPILLQQVEPVQPRDTAGTLGERLAGAGARLLCQALDQIAGGTANCAAQDEGAATYAPKLKPEDERLDWTREAIVLDALIRALLPEPGAATLFGGRRVKILDALIEETAGGPPGTVLAIDRNKGVLVASGQQALWLRRLQLEGRRAMGAAEFARGCRLEVGALFGWAPRNA
jgi:methionyl-tRNA formyltransferase